MAHSAFNYIALILKKNYRVSYLKYWSNTHLNQSFGSYCTQLDSFSLEEVTMKEEIQTSFQRLGYEDEFGPR